MDELQNKKEVANNLRAFFLFIIGNPSIKKFKSYLYNPDSEGIRREYNFLLFSVYTEKDRFYKTYYLGILFNFINLGSRDIY